MGWNSWIPSRVFGSDLKCWRTKNHISYFLSPRSLALYFCIILFQAFVLSFWNFRISVFLSRWRTKKPDLCSVSKISWSGGTVSVLVTRRHTVWGEDWIFAFPLSCLSRSNSYVLQDFHLLYHTRQKLAYGWQGLGSDPRARSQFGCVQFTLMYPVHFGVSLCATGARLTWFNVGTV